MARLRVYLAYSFTQACPEWWRELGHHYVAVSADDVSRYVHVAVKALRGLHVLIDSGAFRIVSRGRVPDPHQVIGVQKIVVDELNALPVALDHPVAPGVGEEIVKAANRKTATNALLWVREFGDHFVYPLHGHTPSQIDYAIELMIRTAPSVRYVGLGSQAILSRRNPCLVYRLVEYLSSRLDKAIHVFGVGNTTLLLLATTDIALSVDTASPLHDARYGLSRHPKTLSMTVTASRRLKGSRPRANPLEIAKDCRCPVCTTVPGLLANWGREGVKARAVHNAYQLFRMLKNPYDALSRLKRRCQGG